MWKSRGASGLRSDPSNWGLNPNAETQKECLSLCVRALVFVRVRVGLLFGLGCVWPTIYSDSFGCCYVNDMQAAEFSFIAFKVCEIQGTHKGISRNRPQLEVGFKLQETWRCDTINN